MNCSRRKFIAGAACAVAVTAMPILPILPALGVLSTVSTIDGVLLAKGDTILFRGGLWPDGVYCVIDVNGGVTTVTKYADD